MVTSSKTDATDAPPGPQHWEDTPVVLGIPSLTSPHLLALGVCLVGSFGFLTVEIHAHLPSQHTEHFPCPTASPDLWQPLICSSLLWFSQFQSVRPVESQVCHLWGLTLLRQHKPLEIPPGHCTYSWFLDLAEQYSMVWDPQVLHLSAGSSITTNFLALWAKLQWTFVCRFLCEHGLSFSWDKCSTIPLDVSQSSCIFRPL